MVKSSALRLAGMAKEMYADREKTEEKWKKELARRQDDYERHLKEVPDRNACGFVQFIG